MRGGSTTILMGCRGDGRLVFFDVLFKDLGGVLFKVEDDLGGVLFFLDELELDGVELDEVEGDEAELDVVGFVDNL